MRKQFILMVCLSVLLAACSKRPELPDNEEEQTTEHPRDPDLCAAGCSDMDDAAMRNASKALERHIARFIANSKTDPEIRAFESREITIPVVVHVIYNRNEPKENISEAQIESQVKALNRAFNPPQSDAGRVPPVFRAVYAGETGIRFTLEAVTRTASDTSVWLEDLNEENKEEEMDDMKRTDRGGAAAIRSDKYLNIWVCRLTKKISGFASFPYSKGGDWRDGVVISTHSFGTIGLLNMYAAEGKTAVHEVGHWLGLYHPWGRDQKDSSCEEDDDFVADTPPSKEAHYGCTTKPVYSCGSRTMTMNYMDYANDPCAYMFTKGQVERMRAVLYAGGPRAALSGL